MESQLATLATDTGTTFAKLFQVEGIQTILFKFWAFRVYTLNNLTPIRLFCVKGRFSGLSGIKTDHAWPEIRPLGFKGLMAQNLNIPRRLWKIETTHRGVATHSLRTTALLHCVLIKKTYVGKEPGSAFSMLAANSCIYGRNCGWSM